MNTDITSTYRIKALLFGGLFGACVGAVIGSLTGLSTEALATGLIGGWLVGELVTFGAAMRASPEAETTDAAEHK